MTAELLTLSSYNRGHLPAIRTAITEVYGEVWSAESPGDPFHSVERFAERLTGHASSEGWACVIGEVSGDVVGFAYGRPDSVGEWQTVINPVDSGVRDYGAKGTFGLCDIMVRVPWRGQKIARAIHDEPMRNRTELRASPLMDSTRPGMRALYEKWGFPVLDQEAGVRGLGVQGLEGDHGVGQVELGEHGPEDGDFVGLGVHLALGGDQAGAGHRGKQVDLGAIRAACAPHRLAVHGQGTSGLLKEVLVCQRAAGVPSGEPGTDRVVECVAVDALQDPAHGGLGRSSRAAGFTFGPPRAASTGDGASAAHSAIAVRDLAPVSTAQAANERTKARG